MKFQLYDTELEIILGEKFNYSRKGERDPCESKIMLDDFRLHLSLAIYPDNKIELAMTREEWKEYLSQFDFTKVRIDVPLKE